MRRIAVVSVAAILAFGSSPGAAREDSSSPGAMTPQSAGRLVPLVTDQSITGLSSLYGTPSSGVLNQAGDFAFIGSASSALFVKRAGSSTTTRVWQMGDTAPGIPNSRTDIIQNARITPSGPVVFTVQLAMTNGETQGTVMSWDGTTVSVIANGAEIAPGTGGLRYERNLSGSANDAGDILLSATLANSASVDPVPKQTWFLKKAGQAITKIIGVGDPVSGVPGGTFATPMAFVSFTNTGEFVFTGAISGGTGGNGLFVAANGSIRKVAATGDAAVGVVGTLTTISSVTYNAAGEALFTATINGGPASGVWVDTNGSIRKVAATGDPSPLAGTFTAPAARGINDSGRVLFVDGSSVFLNTSGGGTVIGMAGGTALPGPLGGTTSTTVTPTLVGFSASGEVILSQTITGGTGNLALLRITAALGLEVIAYRGQTAPGGVQTFQTFSGTSYNATGLLTFLGSDSAGVLGVFQQASGGGLLTLARDGQATGTSVGGTFDVSGTGTQTLNTGPAYFQADVNNGSADHAGFVGTPGALTVLMNTGAILPAGAKTAFRMLFAEAAGEYVGFPVQKSGGRLSYGVHHIATGTTRVVVTDGDPSPLPAGGRLRITAGASGSIYVTPGGVVPILATVVGGTNPGAVILAGLPNGTLAKIVAPGDLDTGNRVLGSPTFGTSGPPIINSSGQLVFGATVNGGNRGFFVGSAGTTPVKAAFSGDATAGGPNLNASNPTSGTPLINDAGQVLFTGNLVNGTQAGGPIGWFLTTGGAHERVAVVGDAAPGGGTFAAFARPFLNSSGEVVFMATLTGGAGSGAFLYTPGVGLTAVALNGTAAPGGGTFNMPVLRPDIIINDQHDVLLLSDLTGASATAAYFIRRGLGGSLESIVRQGDPAPGTSGTFLAFLHTLNTIPGEFSQLSDNGDVSFLGRVVEGNIIAAGVWRVHPDNSVTEMVIRGSLPPEFGGGAIISSSQRPDWTTGSRLATRVLVGGGPFGDSIMLYVSNGLGTVTSVGSNVSVSPTDETTGTAPVTVQFSSVTQAGSTSLTTSTGAPALPASFALGAPPLFYQVSSAAVFNGAITVCIDFAGHTFPQGAVIRLLHYENNAWVDVTTGGPSGTIICGTTTSLSPFVVVQAMNEPTANLIQNGSFGSGITSWQLFELPDIVHNNAANGVFEYYRAAPASTPSGQAVILQDTGVPVAAGAPVVSHFDLGNSDSVRKRISVLIRSADFSDLHVCTFWLPANAPMRTYAMRTHATIAWAGASISFYAASGGTITGTYQLDNVVMGPGSGLSLKRTDCVDPLEPGVADLPDGLSLLANGNFSGGDGAIINGPNPNSPWIGFGTLTAQVTNGVAQFIRPSSAAPSGALVQPTGVPVAAGNIVTARFELGNSSTARKRVTILLHDQFFADLSACTFWLPAGQPLSPYTMRAYVTANWSSAMISFYPATTDQAQWFELDNVNMGTTPGVRTSGADCVEPGDVSGLPPAPAPTNDAPHDTSPGWPPRAGLAVLRRDPGQAATA